MTIPTKGNARFFETVIDDEIVLMDAAHFLADLSQSGFIVSR